MILLYACIAVIITAVSFVAVMYVQAARSRRAYEESRRESAQSDAPEELDTKGDTFRRYLRSLKEEHERIDAKQVLGYDPCDRKLSSLRSFMPLKMKTACIFSKRSLAWGAPDWNESLSLEQNAVRIAPALKLFMTAAKGLALDAFVVELRGEQYCKDLKSFGRAVYFLLRTLCDVEENCACMRRSYIGKYGWWFEYCHDFVFLTTFAPFYDATHSRHQYDAPRTSCFVLFQPEFSFARRNISCGHEATKWTKPESERDVVRVAFLNKQQNYVKRDCDAANPEFARQLTLTHRPKNVPLFGLTADEAAKHNARHDDDDDDDPAKQVSGPTAWQIVKDTNNAGIQTYVEWWRQDGNTFADVPPVTNNRDDDDNNER